MSYQSIKFLLFTGVVLIFYYGFGRKRQRVVLALANLCFYCAAGLKYLPFLLATTALTFFSAKSIGKVYAEAEVQLAQCDAKQKKEIRAQAKARAKKRLLPGLLGPIALLVVCKYTGFIFENINHLLGAIKLTQIPMFRMILPLGISFYTFMAISYVLDVYWKRYTAEERFLPYAVYVTYFPHLVQGPINRYNEFRDQTKERVAFDSKNLSFGAQLMLWGLFKKLVVADRIAMFVDQIFSHWSEHQGIVLIAAVAVYSIQIYADFSGCIDIVTGVSEMMGIHMRKNFNHPYFSRTMAEFWRRWHISLQEWFKDYIYFPVSASETVRKVKKYYRGKDKKDSAELFAACFPIFVVWVVTGIWHGADWKYVVWGMFHAALLIGSKLTENRIAAVSRKIRLNTDHFLWKGVQMLRTFFLCCVGRIFFRADSLASAMGMIGRMLHSKISMHLLLHPASPYGISDEDLILSVIVVIVLLITDIIQEKIRIRETLARKPIALRWFIIFAGLFAVLILGVYGPGFNTSAFIYEQF